MVIYIILTTIQPINKKIKIKMATKQNEIKLSLNNNQNESNPSNIDRFI